MFVLPAIYQNIYAPFNFVSSVQAAASGESNSDEIPQDWYLYGLPGTRTGEEECQNKKTPNQPNIDYNGRIQFIQLYL